MPSTIMDEAIKHFHTQLSYDPIVENAGVLKKTDKVAICGMGGSHLAGDLLKIRKPCDNIVIHSDYGLPRTSDVFLHEGLLIASSYSGNTEEVVDTFTQAIEKNLNIAVMATGGMLLELAEEYAVPYVAVPKTGIQPRAALGYSLKAMLKLMGDEKMLVELSDLATTLNPKSIEPQGRALAKNLMEHVPVIYTSTANEAIAYNWKIKFNETGKIPAFYNVFPELNHNEMTGFDPAKEKGAPHSEDAEKARLTLNIPFTFIFIKDAADHQRIQRRMDMLAKLYRDRNLPVTVLELSGDSLFEKIFSSLLLADWTAYYTAEYYGLESEDVPVVEEFKKLIHD